ncbi:Kinetochore protein NDC80 [Nymphon striatum]|nr:Kinetochore protein NDC80 [Nymphon striatum]
MRRSSVSERTSFAAPLRTQNDGRASLHQGSTTKPTGVYSSVSRQSVPSKPSNLPIAATPRQLFGAPSGRNSRGSMASSRTSYSRGDLKKDTRPIFDKAYQNSCIKKLVEFLVNRNYPYKINSKVLVSPMNKDFAHIFQFLYQQIEPKFALSPKFEEEVPRLLKNLGYPYNITKSAFCTVGSRHSWPSILASLNWLKDYIEYLDFSRQEIDALRFPSEDFEGDSMSENKASLMLYNFYQEFYGRYAISGEEVIEEENDAMKRIALRIVGRDLPCDPSCDVESELIRCEEDLQYLENQPNPLEELKKKEHSLKSDIHDFDKYLHDLQEHSQRKETDIENLKFEVENLKTVVDAQRKQVEEKENIVKAHNVSEHDIERLRRHKEELQHQLARHIKETNEYDKELNEMQIEIANLTGVVEKDCSKFNELYQKTAVVTKSQLDPNCFDPESTNQIDQEISLPEMFELKVSFCQRQHLEWMNQIKPTVLKAKTVLAERIEKMRDDMVDGEELKHKVNKNS